MAGSCFPNFKSLLDFIHYLKIIDSSFRLGFVMKGYQLALKIV